MVTTSSAATIKATTNLSGYVHLHVPVQLCRLAQVTKGTIFAVTFTDNRLVISQCKEA